MTDYKDIHLNRTADSRVDDPVIADTLHRLLDVFQDTPSDFRASMLSSLILSVILQFTEDPRSALENLNAHTLASLDTAIAMQQTVGNG